MGMISNIKVWNLKRQVCSTLEDLENKELGDLAKRLKGNSDKETLTNVLEWQHRNINYWMERWILDLPLRLLTPLYLFLSIIVSLFVYALFYLISLPFLGSVWSVYIGAAAAVIFVLLSLFQSTIIRVIFVLLLSFPAFIIIKLSVHQSLSNASSIDSGLILVLLNGVLFGASLFTLIYLWASYSPIYRRETRKSKIQKLYRIILDTFKISLPIERILSYRMAICRDYANLTASLLFNLNPDIEVYFITIPWHVAVAVKVNNAYYVLDQRLPILTIDGWLMRWHQKDADIFISKVLRDPNGTPVSVDFSEHGKYKRIAGSPTTSLPKIDTERLTAGVTNALGIEQGLHRTEPDFEKPLRNLATYIDNNITEYSLIRAIKNMLESEFCDNINKVSEIRIYQNERDLIVAVYLGAKPLLRPLL
ncbi:Transglutaminase-like domain protein [uncultured archaeon]|nr:Transglutaminase-like domain protein [uncultured archaeon]